VAVFFRFIIGNWVTGSGPSYLWVVGLVSAHGLRGDFSMARRLCGFGFEFWVWLINYMHQSSW